MFDTIVTVLGQVWWIVAVIVAGVLILLYGVLVSERWMHERHYVRGGLGPDFLIISLGSAVIFVGIVLAAQYYGPKRSEVDTSGRPSTDDAAQQSGNTNQGPKPTPKPEEPLTVKSTTCVLREAQTSDPKVSTAETSELQVTVSVPSNARECHDTVTVDAPTFGLGKEANQPVSVVRPQETQLARWLLDPEKPGRWTIAVETKRDRALVPVAVTTPLGFPATWVQAGALFAGAATVIFGVLAFYHRGR
jgi:hypothetical protein